MLRNPHVSGMVETGAPAPVHLRLVESGTLEDVNKSQLITSYMDNRAALHRFLTARLRDPAAAEDILQEMYLKLERTSPGKPVVNIDGFLFKMAHNLALDHRRQKKRQEDRNKAWNDAHQTRVGDYAVDTSPGAETTLTTKQEVQELATAINALPPKCRKIFVAHKIKGLSHREISEHYGVATSTIEKHIAKAMKYLVFHLKGQD